MKQQLLHITFILLAFLPLSVSNAQKCDNYDCMIGEAKAAYAIGDFVNAFNKFKAAKAYDTNPAKAKEVDTWIDRTFDGIDKQRKEAKQNAERAIKSEAQSKKVLAKSERLIAHFIFSQGRAWVFKNGKFAIVDREGNKLTDYVFSDPIAFMSSGYAIASKDGAYYFINLNGKLASDGFDWLYPTNNGWFKAKIGDDYTFVDNTGKIVKGYTKYKTISTFENGVAIVKDSLYSLINIKGEKIVKEQFASVSKLEDGAFMVNLSKNKISADNIQYRSYKSFAASSLIELNKDDDEEDKGNIPTSYNFNIVSKSVPQQHYSHISAKGYYLIDTTFNLLSDFSNGFALVEKKGKYGYINTERKIAIKPQFDAAGDFDWDGNAEVRQGKLFGLIDTFGNFLIKPQYERIERSYKDSSLFIVEQKEKYGLITNKGQMLVEAQFDKIDYSNAYAFEIRLKGFYGLIDKKGNILIPPSFDHIYDFFKGFSKVKMKNKYGIINEKGVQIVAPEYDKVGDFYNDLAYLNKDNKWGFVNTVGKLIIPLKYDSVSSFNKGYAIVRQNEQWAIINKDDKQLLPFQNNEIRDEYEDYFIMLDNKKWIKIDSSGKKIDLKMKSALPRAYIAIPEKLVKKGFDSIGTINLDRVYDEVDTFYNGLARVMLKGKWGFINIKGKLVIPLQFTEALDFKENMAAVEQNDKWGYVDTLGKMVIIPQFDEAFSFENGVAEVVSDRYYVPVSENIRTHVPTSMSVQSNHLLGNSLEFYSTVSKKRNRQETFKINKKGEMVIDEDREKPPSVQATKN